MTYYIKSYNKALNYFEKEVGFARLRKRKDLSKKDKDQFPWSYSALRSPQYADKSKIMIAGQGGFLNACIDTEGGTMFGGDIYGLPINNLEINPDYLLGVLNSDISEYFLRHITATHAGPTYKYEDRFVKRLPIIIPQGIKKKKLMEKICKLVKLTKKVVTLNRRLNYFPESYYMIDIERYGIFRKKLLNLSLEPKIRIDRNLYGDVVLFIDGQAISGETKEEVMILKKSITDIRPKGELEIRIPERHEDQQKLLDVMKKDEEKLIKLPELRNIEEDITELIYKLYDINSQDKKIIKSYLMRTNP